MDDEKNVIKESEEKNASPAIKDCDESVKGLQLFILIAAVVVMYLSYIWLPFFTSKYDEDCNFSLWEIVRLIFENSERGYKVEYSETFFLLALIILPICQLVAGLLKKSFITITSIIQLLILLYFTNKYFGDSDLMKMSGGYYFYLLATIATLLVGFVGSDDSTYLAGFLKDVKRKFFTLLFFAVTSMSMMANTHTAIVLLHNGNGTTYDNNQLATAMAAAEHGDSILLSEGAFDVDTLKVDKVVSIIGSGEATVIRGDVHIGIADNPKAYSNMFDAVNIEGDVKVVKELRGLKFRKCQMEVFWASSEVTDVKMDRCYISTFLPVDKIKSASFVNCNLYNVGFEFSFSTQRAYSSAIGSTSKGNDLNFLNCTIEMVCASTTGGWNVLAEDASFVNCNIGFFTDYGDENCSFTYSLLGNSSVNSSCATHNCYYGDDHSTNYTFTSEDLAKKGYLGNDGSIVGCFGGSTPYTLVPSGISVTESELKVDAEKKLLNVTLKISANQ